MKNFTPFHWFVIIGLAILIGLSFISYRRQQQAYAKINKDANQLASSVQRVGTEDKVTVRELMGLIKDQLGKRDIQISTT